MRNRGFTEESQTESLEIRQAKLRAVEAYKEEQALERQTIDHSSASHLVVGVIKDMSLYKAFEDTEAIDYEFNVIDSHMVADPYSERFNFDSGQGGIQELAELQEKAEKAYNASVGTPTEQLAKATLKTINDASGDILADLVFDAESQTF